MRILIRHILSIVITMLIVSALVFALQAFALGDSSSYLLSEESSIEEIEAYRHSAGLDDNPLIRYIRFLISIFTLKWGDTISGQPIKSIILERFPITITLSFFSVILALIISIPCAIISVIRIGSKADKALSLFSIIILSLPSFLLALILSLIFGFYLKWFPIAWVTSSKYSIFTILRSLFLPSLTLALLNSSLFMRMFRESLVDNLDKPYSISFKAQGARRIDLIVKSALKPALPIILSLAFQSLATAFSGAVIVENVFAIPGIGSLLVKASLSRDVYLAGVIVIIVAFFVSIFFILSDIISRVVDPRLRRER